MFSEEFKKDLEKVDDLINEITDLFNEKEISPFVAVAVTDHLKMVAQGGLDQWIEIHRQGKANEEKKELKDVAKELED